MGTGAIEVQFGSSAGGLYLAFGGEATRQVCPTVDRLVTDFLSANREKARIFLDLRDADWIDSTFAGWMLRVRKQLAQGDESGVFITGCGERCQETLHTMRLTALIERSDVPRPDQMSKLVFELGAKPDRAAIELMARAHEELATVNEENHRLFAPIAALLRAELAQGD